MFSGLAFEFHFYLFIKFGIIFAIFARKKLPEIEGKKNLDFGGQDSILDARRAILESKGRGVIHSLGFLG